MILLFSYLSQLKPKNQSTISAISSLFSRYFSQLFQAGHVDSSHDFLCDLKPVADIARAPAWRSSSVKLLFSWKKTIRSQHTLGLRTFERRSCADVLQSTGKLVTRCTRALTRPGGGRIASALESLLRRSAGKKNEFSMRMFEAKQMPCYRRKRHVCCSYFEKRPPNDF